MKIKGYNENGVIHFNPQAKGKISLEEIGGGEGYELLLDEYKPIDRVSIEQFKEKGKFRVFNVLVKIGGFSNKKDADDFAYYFLLSKTIKKINSGDADFQYHLFDKTSKGQKNYFNTMDTRKKIEECIITFEKRAKKEYNELIELNNKGNLSAQPSQKTKEKYKVSVENELLEFEF